MARSIEHAHDVRGHSSDVDAIPPFTYNAGMRHIVASALALALPGCVGPWAQSTHVELVSSDTKTTMAQAEVFQRLCHGGHEPLVMCSHRGSVVKVAVTNAPRRAVYTLVLIRGSCTAPKSRNVIATFWGGDPDNVDVDVPIIPLTSGDYSLMIRTHRGGRAIACAAIKRQTA